MVKIEITFEELADRIAVLTVKEKYSGRVSEELKRLRKLLPARYLSLVSDLKDIHSSMYPLHDILTSTKNEKLKAYLAEVILKLNGIRAELKNDSRTYA